jgi:glycerate kinase
MQEGAERVFGGATFEKLPAADGGEGTVDALLHAIGGHKEQLRVTGPLGKQVPAPLGIANDGGIVIEAAAGSGLSLVEEDTRDPMRASSRGAGELLVAALERRPNRVTMGVGGTASTDGGTGAATAAGWRFLDSRGAELEPGGGALVRLHRIDSGAARRFTHTPVRVACDVDNELVGPGGAARVFAPQKGADPSQVARLEAGLAVLAQRIETDLGLEVAAIPGGGAGGGLGAGLVSFFGARLEPGFDLIAGTAGLSRALSRADLVVTGEGRLDEQTIRGKTVAGVAAVAERAGVRCVAVAGEVALDATRLASTGIADAVGLVELFGRARAESEPEVAIAEATEHLLTRSESND